MTRIYLQEVLDRRDARDATPSKPDPKFYTRASINERLPGGLRASTFPTFYDDGSARWTIYHGYPQDVVGSVKIGSDGRFAEANSWIAETKRALNAAFAEDA